MKKTPLRSRSAPLRSREPARGTPIRKVNRKRKAANLERAHGPAERREWIRTLPCAACGVVGYSVAAHLLGNGGMSRKQDADTTGPLCHIRWLEDGALYIGCHTLYDEHQSLFAQRYPAFDPERIAAETAAAWQSHLRQTGRARQDTDNG